MGWSRLRRRLLDSTLDSNWPGLGLRLFCAWAIRETLRRAGSNERHGWNIHSTVPATSRVEGEIMSCNCEADRKRTYYAAIQLWSDIQDGIPGGPGIRLDSVTVAVCTRCGESRFVVPEQVMLRHFKQPD